MRREFHVRFCEGAGVRFPRATRLLIVFVEEKDARRVEEVLPKRATRFAKTSSTRRASRSLAKTINSRVARGNLTPAPSQNRT